MAVAGQVAAETAAAKMGAVGGSSTAPKQERPLFALYTAAGGSCSEWCDWPKPTTDIALPTAPPP